MAARYPASGDNGSIVGSGDLPGPTGPDTGDDGPPVLVRVGEHKGSRSGLVAVALVALLVVIAVWKPWDRGASEPVTPTGLADRFASAVPSALSATPVVTDLPTATAPPAWPIFEGLDLGSMGVSDAHADWGISVAYVSSRQFDIAVARRTPTITPVVSWEPIEPARSGPGPFVGHPGATSIAIAATWPEGTRALATQLLRVGPPVRVVPLGQDLAAQIAVITGPNPGPVISAVSGAFFLATDRPLSEPLAWTGNGWPPGAYAFQVAIGGGVVVTLPFRIASPTGP